MAGIVTASMPVFVVEDETTGQRAFCSINEGLGKALRFGANSPEVLARLAWIRDAFAPLLKRAIALQGRFDLRAMVEESLRRGDECHNRNKAATTLFFREIAPALVLDRRAPCRDRRGPALHRRQRSFLLSLSMAHAKAVTLGLERERIGSLVTTMAGNGREVGIRVSGTGSRWFTAPAAGRRCSPLPRAAAWPKPQPPWAIPDVTEAIGLGGFALAAAPAIAEFIGGTVAELTAKSERMREITIGEHSSFRIPALGFRGVPSGSMSARSPERHRAHRQYRRCLLPARRRADRRRGAGLSSGLLRGRRHGARLRRMPWQQSLNSRARASRRVLSPPRGTRG